MSGSSLSVNGLCYRLVDQRIMVQFTVQILLFLKDVRTGSGTYPVFYSIFVEGVVGEGFMQGYSGQCVELTAHLHLVLSCQYGQHTAEHDDHHVT